MLNKYNIDEFADRYSNNALSSEEKRELEMELSQDPILQKEWQEAMSIYKALNHAADVAHIHAQLKGIQTPVNKTSAQKTIRFVKQHWKNAAVAASLLLAAVSSYNYYDSKHNLGNNNNQFTQLSREVEHIKMSQNSLRKTIETAQKSEPDQSGLGGTGFAIANDGYIATNYHVVSNSKNIYITTHDNNNYSASIIGYDALKDIAILKINDAQFRFSKHNIPYTIIDKQDKVLGLKVFSIGFPQENIVYNEGYISAEKGYANDSLSYQLEIIANPGQSGSPIIDKNGNILGLINGKLSNTPGSTNAVQSKALLNLIKRLPEHIKIATPKNSGIAKLDRTEQVEVLKNFVVNIKATY